MYLTLLLFSSFSAVYAGSAGHNDSCNIANNRLQVGTFQFYSDCNSQTYCEPSNSTCQPKRCRKDDFPFGYPQGSGNVPDKCDRGFFCPDEADKCQPWQKVGQPCQLNRDDQCEGPPNFKELADESHRGLNFNGSVCINNVCMWANVTLNESCEVENTGYIAYGADGEFIDIVSRGNCRLGLYCDSQTKKCLQTKVLGDTCGADKECESLNCLDSGVCGESAATPRQLGAWVYAVVALAIIIGMLGTLFGLFLLHRRRRDQEREKRAQYWREQNAFHQNLLQLRDTARASLLSLPGNGNSARSTMYSRDGNSDESHAPILQHAAPAPKSGLRYIADDSSEFSNEGLMMQQPQRRADGRF